MEAKYPFIQLMADRDEEIDHGSIEPVQHTNFDANSRLQILVKEECNLVTIARAKFWRNECYQNRYPVIRSIEIERIQGSNF